MPSLIDLTGAAVAVLATATAAGLELAIVGAAGAAGAAGLAGAAGAQAVATTTSSAKKAESRGLSMTLRFKPSPSAAIVKR
jgi:hypothetical protein